MQLIRHRKGKRQRVKKKKAQKTGRHKSRIKQQTEKYTMENPERKEHTRADNDSQIKELEERIANTKYNKRTQSAIGLMKAQLARLKEKREARSAKKINAEGYAVRKTGDASAIMLGFPSVGKSTLLNAITNAESEVAAYAFTTLTVIPGVLTYNHAKIQVLDVPGVVHGAASGRGRGREVLSVMRSADMTLIIIDVNYPEHHQPLLNEIRDSGIRINETPPDVKIMRKPYGGIRVATTVKLTKLDKETVKNVLKEFKIANADVVIRSDLSIDQFIDVVEKNKIYMPAITLLTKIDMVSKERLEELKKMIKPDLCISAHTGEGIEELKKMIFDKLSFIRLYCKEIGKDADLNVPMIMFKGTTIREMCRKLHKDFESKFKFARVWGKSAKFPGQKFMMDHTLFDGDIVELHIR